MAGVAVYVGFVIGNLVLIAAYALVGPRLAWVCCVALCLNALAVVVLLFPAPDRLLGSHPPPRATEAGMVLLRRGVIPLRLTKLSPSWRG
jgi:hypothetical protein